VNWSSPKKPFQTTQLQIVSEWVSCEWVEGLDRCKIKKNTKEKHHINELSIPLASQLETTATSRFRTSCRWSMRSIVRISTYRFYFFLLITCIDYLHPFSCSDTHHLSSSHNTRPGLVGANSEHPLWFWSLMNLWTGIYTKFVFSMILSFLRPSLQQECWTSLDLLSRRRLCTEKHSLCYTFIMIVSEHSGIFAKVTRWKTSNWKV